MKKLENEIHEFDKQSPLSVFYEFGLSPDEIKNEIINCFSFYFQNKEILEEQAIPLLTNNWLSYITIYRDTPDSLKQIEIVLDIFNDAKKADKDSTIRAYNLWFTDISQSISRFWSLYKHQQDVKEMCNEDFTEESLRMIGSAIEGLSKPFLKLLLHLNRIKRNKPYDFADIQSKDLGIVIDELINTTSLDSILTIDPNGIRLNQWRNIAYHHNSKVIDSKITLSYKNNGEPVDFEITRDQLYKTTKNVFLTFKLIRIAETIFCVDNMESIQQTRNKSDEESINIRQEAKLLNFHAALGSQGFKIGDFNYDKDCAMLDIKDMMDYPDFSKRAIHSSQFLYQFWIFTQSKRLIVNYFIPTGEKFLTAEIEADEFDNSTEREGSISELLKNVQFTFVTIDFAQNIDPFEEWKLSQEIIDSSGQFFSQLGEPISTKEFAKQFLLSVFTNYLACISEGLSGIKINIGGDGAMVRTENQVKNIILHQPAIIRNKELQLELIGLFGRLVDLYEKGELVKDIVDQAKLNNKYYFKKGLIKEQLTT